MKIQARAAGRLRRLGPGKPIGRQHSYSNVSAGWLDVLLRACENKKEVLQQPPADKPDVKK